MLLLQCCDQLTYVRWWLNRALHNRRWKWRNYWLLGLQRWTEKWRSLWCGWRVSHCWISKCLQLADFILKIILLIIIFLWLLWYFVILSLFLWTVMLVARIHILCTIHLISHEFHYVDVVLCYCLRKNLIVGTIKASFCKCLALKFFLDLNYISHIN